MGLLRLFLALSVVVAHNQFAHHTMGPGTYVSVKAFFVISGFYMALILSGKYESLGQFYLSRFLRLYPIYLAVLVLTYALAVAAGGSLNALVNLTPWSQVSQGLAALLALVNVSMVGIDLSVLGCAGPEGIVLYKGQCPSGAYFLNNFMLVPQAWSISLELAFYAIAPLITRVSNRWLAALIVVGLAMRFGLAAAGLNANPWHRSVAPFEMVYFFLGIAAYRLYASGMLRHAGLGLALLAITPFYASIWFYFGASVVAEENVTWWLYIAAVTLGLPSLFSLTKAVSWDRAIGELSYPVYTTHILIMALIDRFVGMSVANAVGLYGWLALNIACILAFSWLCVKFVQAPLDTLRYRLAFRDRALSSATARVA